MRKTSLMLAAALLLTGVSANAQTTSEKQAPGSLGTVYVISNAHLDSQWNWDVQTTINEYIPATLYRNLTLLEQYPDYVFNCESGIKYAWMKEYYPDGYAKLRKYIQEGRWHLSGSAWEASDANVPSTEALTRNILLGQHFYENEFGVLSTDIFLPDCFGFGQHLPTIAAHCGLIGFTTQKLQWRNNPFYGDSKEPFAYGKWRGVDGNEIYADLRMDSYTHKFGGSDISYDEDLMKKLAESPNGITPIFYGVGDVGGSPTLLSVQSVQKGVHGDGPLKIVSATSDQLFKDVEAKHIPVETFDGELLMDVHGTGCYTSEAAMKLFNRRNELLADAAERASSVAEIMTGEKYPLDEFTTIWRRFIWHQFHDDLTGTSIPRAYEFSWNDELLCLKQSEAIEENAVGAFSSRLDTRTSGTPLVLYNPSAFARKDVVTIAGAWKVYDQNGKAVASQVTADGTMFVASTPALGYAVYSVKEAKAAKTVAVDAQAKKTTISNSVYTLTVDENGDVCSIVDRRNGRELVENGKTIRLAAIDGDKSYAWPAWEITKEVIDKESHGIYDNVTVAVVENGPVCKAIRVTKTLGDSKFTQYVRLYEGATADRIDFVNDVDWHSPATLIKAEFPLTISNPDARYDIGTGSLERDNNTLTKYEVYAQQWADLSEKDGSYGVSILNDCKYGWDKPADNELRLTLFHTPETKRGYRYHDHQDFGHHLFTYSIVAHDGDFNKCGTVDKADALNQPVRSFFAQKHTGDLGKQWSGLSVSGASVKAFKKAEDGDGYILRVYEVSGKPSTAAIEFALPVASIEELNGNEKPLTKAAEASTVNGKNVTLALGKFGIRTIRVRFQGAAESAAMPQQPMTFTFNARSATFNAFRKFPGFNHDGESYAAELMPDTVFFRGTSFPISNPMEKNALRCSGDILQLPAGSWNKVRMLVASNAEDIRVNCEVLAPQGTGRKAEAAWTKQAVTVPSFKGFIGQWGHTGHTVGYVKPADVAYVGTHMHTADPDKDQAYMYTYMYCIEVELPAGATAIKLPADRKVVLFSAVAVNDANREVTAADGGVNGAENIGTALRLGVPATADPELAPEVLCLNEGNVVASSGKTTPDETPAMMFDDDPSTKWSQKGGPGDKWVEVDLGEVRPIKGWDVTHAVKERASYYTADFCLQVRNSQDEEWNTVDSVVGNTKGTTSRDLAAPVEARYVRLYVTKAHQTALGDGDCGTTRIAEFSLR